MINNSKLVRLVIIGLLFIAPPYDTAVIIMTIRPDQIRLLHDDDFYTSFIMIIVSYQYHYVLVFWFNSHASW